jgi:hypothetical protein
VPSAKRERMKTSMLPQVQQWMRSHESPQSPATLWDISLGWVIDCDEGHQSRRGTDGA